MTLTEQEEDIICSCIVQQAKDNLRKLKKAVAREQKEYVQTRIRSLYKYCDILVLFSQRKTFVAETRAYLDTLPKE